ncbi:MAG: response regulator [Deltaproteobacteria bacterium]|nr:response regulator [Candidatus Anaeroferrophillacea bacterium]
MTARQKILIVDDRKENLFALRQVLGDVDAEFVEATSGNEALAATLDNDFAVAILDVQMPEMTGYELAEYLRGDKKSEAMPIIFLSAAYADEQHVFKGYESGGVDYIAKPYPPLILISKLKVFLEIDRNRRELARHRDHLETLVAERTAELTKTIGELGTAEERLRIILDSLDAVVSVVDMETYELLFMNKCGREIWGDYAGRKCWEILQAGQSGPCPFCTNDRLLAADGTPTGVYAWEFQNTTNNHWYDCRDQAIPWHDGRLVRIEIATDISRRKEAEEEIRKAKEEWERTFDAIGDIVTIQDANHHILLGNRKAYEEFGLQPGELVGKFCYELFHGGTTPCDKCPAVLAARDMTIHNAEIVNKEQKRIFSVSASPLRGPDGRLLNIVYIARDITEMKSLERQLRHAQKMEAIGTLAGGIAHDFNNILSPVLGYAEIIAEGAPADSDLAGYCQQILNAGMRARDLVKQILTFSRETEQEFKPIQLHLVVKEVLKLLRSSMPSTIEIKHKVDTLALVTADPTMVHQIVMNLCTNAYYAMRETGGTLAVCLEEVELDADDYITELDLRSGRYLRLEISDSGCGMPREIQDRIFEPYFTTKAQGEGTGLGLSLVHGIVTKLGGHITVYSEPGKGATFHVYLPKYEGEKGRAEALATAVSLPRGHEHILIVDDEKMIAKIMQTTLESLGYRVTSCVDSRQALEQFEARPESFDLVLSDVTMPVLTGVELARRILLLRPELPIILCTGFSAIINEEKAKSLGIRRLLKKPVPRCDLAMALREELDRTQG